MTLMYLLWRALIWGLLWQYGGYEAGMNMSNCSATAKYRVNEEKNKLNEVPDEIRGTSIRAEFCRILI